MHSLGLWSKCAFVYRVTALILFTGQNVWQDNNCFTASSLLRNSQAETRQPSGSPPRTHLLPIAQLPTHIRKNSGPDEMQELTVGLATHYPSWAQPNTPLLSSTELGARGCPHLRHPGVTNPAFLPRGHTWRRQAEGAKTKLCQELIAGRN